MGGESNICLRVSPVTLPVELVVGDCCGTVVVEELGSISALFLRLNRLRTLVEMLLIL